MCEISYWTLGRCSYYPGVFDASSSESDAKKGFKVVTSQGYLMSHMNAEAKGAAVRAMCVSQIWNAVRKDETLLPVH